MAGAAKKMSSHLSKQGKKGNKKRSTSRRTSQAGASTRVGGYAGANFSNHIGRNW